MKQSQIKKMLFMGVALCVLSAAPAVYAAADHGHAHEKGEDSHGPAQDDHVHGHGHGDGVDHDEGVVVLSAQQIAAAGITVAPVGAGQVSRTVAVPGKVVAAADRLAQVVSRVGGTVAVATKNLGDRVEKGEVLARIESRDMAEAVAEYQAARRAEELAGTVSAREKTLWGKKISAEQDYLTARNAHQEAKIRRDLAKQKLQALGHDVNTVTQGDTRFHDLRAPLSGRIIARDLTLGEYVDTTRAAFTVADLGVVWVETAIAPAELPFVSEGLSAQVTRGSDTATGTLIFVSPAIDPETRAAKAIIALDNADGRWRAGEFVTATIAASAQQAGMIVPAEAVQIIEGASVVFVRTEHGFKKRDVVTGRADGASVEIVSGVSTGTPIAVSNTFTLKAELGKSEAGHEH